MTNKAAFVRAALNALANENRRVLGDKVSPAYLILKDAADLPAIVLADLYDRIVKGEA